MHTDEELMELAITEALLALSHGDVPIGAIVVHGDDVIASRHNERELLQDPTAHAELLAIRDAAKHIGSWRLDQATVVSTVEPCPMCAGGLVASRIKRLVVGAPDLKAGAVGSLYNLATDPRLNHEIALTNGVQSERCGSIVREFFAAKRTTTL